MKKTLFYLLILINQPLWAQLGIDIASWEAKGFHQPELSYLHMASQPKKLSLSFDIVLFRNSGWSKELIQSYLPKLKETYDKCGLSLGTIRLIEVSVAESDQTVASGYILGDVQSISKRTPIKAKPIVYLFRETGTQTNAFAKYPQNMARSDHSYVNTIWLSYEAHMFYLPYASVAFDVLSHEFGHLLLNRGHKKYGKPNLMGNTLNMLSGDLDKVEQCEIINNSPLLQAI